MLLPKPVINYIKDREKNSPIAITEISGILRRSGYKNFVIFTSHNQDLVLLDMNRDIMKGVVIKQKTVQGFQNTEDYRAVTLNAYARYRVLGCISNGEDLERAKEIFRGKRTWVIHYVKSEDKPFEAHTHGMENYSHPNFRIEVDIGEKEVAYLFNSLCKSVQRGNIFEDGNKISGLYENCHVKLTKSVDGFFDVELIALENPTISDDSINESSTEILAVEPVNEENDEEFTAEELTEKSNSEDTVEEDAVSDEESVESEESVASQESVQESQFVFEELTALHG